jgi:hypothetical protein
MGQVKRKSGPGARKGQGGDSGEQMGSGSAGKARNLYLSDAVFERLQLTAIRRGKTISAVAGELLDRYLPNVRITDEA